MLLYKIMVYCSYVPVPVSTLQAIERVLATALLTLTATSTTLEEECSGERIDMLRDAIALTSDEVLLARRSLVAGRYSISGQGGGIQ